MELFDKTTGTVVPASRPGTGLGIGIQMHCELVCHWLCLFFLCRVSDGVSFGTNCRKVGRSGTSDVHMTNLPAI